MAISSCVSNYLEHFICVLFFDFYILVLKLNSMKTQCKRPDLDSPMKQLNVMSDFSQLKEWD